MNFKNMIKRKLHHIYFRKCFNNQRIFEYLTLKIVHFMPVCLKILTCPDNDFYKIGNIVLIFQIKP